MKKHIGRFLLILILLITMAGCGSMEKEMTEGEKDKEDKIQIGLCFDSFVIERWQRDRDISLDEVSREVNISPYYFSKLFKDSTEQNFIEYLTNLRMDKAKELLLTTDSSMKEICSMVGYADPNYFSRTFKKNIGVTPTEYKENKGDTVG